MDILCPKQSPLSLSSLAFEINPLFIYKRCRGFHHKKLDMELIHPQFPRITFDQNKCSGKPCIRGLRFPVATLLGYVAGGMKIEQMIEEFPFLEKEDFYEAMAFAALTLEDKFVPLQKANT